MSATSGRCRGDVEGDRSEVCRRIDRTNSTGIIRLQELLDLPAPLTEDEFLARIRVCRCLRINYIVRL